MFFERIISKGLAHFSYMIGDGTDAVVIDPRRDCEIYREKAFKNGFVIRYILETHRNEDYLIGSVGLASKTGAEIWHADRQWDYTYGNPAEDGQTWKVGQIKIKALHTPGHTPGHMSYLLFDPDGFPWFIFTGDALFAGDVGRVDLLGMEKVEQSAGLLFASIFEKILPLGDGVIVCPAHGEGSVCGSAISGRIWTTIGIERRANPKLQFRDKNQFISHIGRELERPLYFSRMERFNLQGNPAPWYLSHPPPLDIREFEARAKDAVVVDTRLELGFSAAHVPGSLSIWLGGLAGFAGWFLPYDTPLLLVNEAENPEEAARILIRLGYDRIEGYLAGGMLSWHMAGLESRSVLTVTVQELCRLLDARENPSILDVRSKEELERNGRIRDARHIHITALPQCLSNVPKESTVYIFCGSGLRSMIAASLLQREGWTKIKVVLGGLAGWNSVRCPLR
jgi:hydroxyacylglutathione hydrolase